MKKKRAFTLMEIIIVIFLIGIITGVISYNMRGSLDGGRAFKTEHAISQLTDILEMEIAKGDFPPETIVENPLQFLRRSGLVKNPTQLIRDGWNNPLEITINKNGALQITSTGLRAYRRKQSATTRGLKENDSSLTQGTEDIEPNDLADANG